VDRLHSEGSSRAPSISASAGACASARYRRSNRDWSSATTGATALLAKGADPGRCSRSCSAAHPATAAEGRDPAFVRDGRRLPRDQRDHGGGSARHRGRVRLPLPPRTAGGRGLLRRGAAAQGTFHESLNMASIWRLPVVYVCENNRYAMSMPSSARRPSRRSPPAPRLRPRRRGCARSGWTGWTSPPSSARCAASSPAPDAGRPGLLEAATYRFLGHSKSDPRAYRTREENPNGGSATPSRVSRRLRRLGAP